MQKAKKTIKAVFVSYFLKIRISGAIIKNEKIWKKFPNRLDPPPRNISDFFEFQTFLKIAAPPTDIKLEHFLISYISYTSKIANYTISQRLSSVKGCLLSKVVFRQTIDNPPRSSKFPNSNCYLYTILH